MNAEDEVRAAWKSVNWGAQNMERTSFGVVIYEDENGVFFVRDTQESAWQAALDFTRKRQQEIAQRDEEIVWIEMDCAKYPNTDIPKRILSRLTAQRDELKKGMR